MSEIALAFFWHQHQPYYPDDVSGENPMPWVRLHGVKDYYGMALHLLEVPEMRCTINLVPSLVLQLLAYTDKGATDRPMQVSRIPAKDLTEDESLYLLDHFFMANPERMIRPLPRYFELYHRRGLGKNTAKEVLRRYNERDLRDLQVLFNLAWLHPLAIAGDPVLQGLVEKGRLFSEEDKQFLLDKHLEILKQVLPLHRLLAERGQVELTTTPYFHPILPLLLDKKLAREAMPGVKLPRYTGGYPEDAAVHVKRAMTQHTRIFGKAPLGMWPAEGSVCQSMIPLLAEQGIRWIASDEEVLSHSLPGAFGRDANGAVRNPERLYRPYRVREADRELSMVFRDHALSDMIGFHYQRSDATAAVNDFVGHLHNIRHALPVAGPALVSIILDGENCWEHYPDGGVPFLRTLYQRCVATPGIRPVKIGEFLEQSPPRETLPHLFAGSWISHNFAIWIGHEEDNTAWDALHAAREHLQRRSAAHAASQAVLEKAWEELYIAEGSDWFWWFGDDHSSAQDALFDFLFRKHLQNIYYLLGDPAPTELTRPIRRQGQKALHSLPRNFLEPKIDGRQTFFEWVGAGQYSCKNERGTMAQATRGPLKELLFGFNLRALLVRIDLERPARQALAEFDLLRLVFMEPIALELQIRQAAGQPAVEVLRRGEPFHDPTVEVAVDQIVEVALPFAVLGVKVDEPLAFFAEVVQAGLGRDRAPREGAIFLTTPSADYERIMWDV